MKIKAISGGAFKIPALISASYMVKADGNYDPDIIAGVSSGAIVAMIEAIDAWKEADELVLDDQVRLRYKVFDKRPYKLNGKPTIGAALRLLRGCDHIASMGNLRNTLKQIITPESFRRWKKSARKGEAPQVVVVAVNMTSGARKGFWLHTMSYLHAIDALMASCAFPGFAAPVEIEGVPYHDGGIRNHCPGAWLLNSLDFMMIDPELEKVDLVSIYSRPHDFRAFSGAWKMNFFKTVLRAVEIMEFENSKKDEMLELKYIEDFGGEYKAICIESFLPTPFEDDPKLLHKGYQYGINAYNKYYRKKRRGGKPVEPL